MILVIDVGGTTTRLGISRIGVRLDRHLEIPTPKGHDGLRQLAAIAESKLLKGHKAQAVVAGLPGTFTKRGGLHRLKNLPDWNGLDPRQALQPLTDGDVLFSNDAVMAALGEAHAGAGTTRGVMAYMTVSTGINGARLVNGRPDPTGHYELGEQLMSWDPPVTLGDMVSGRALQERYGRLPSSIDDPGLWQREIKVLAAGLHNLSVHWSPDLIVLGGSMMRDLPLPMIEAELKKLPNPYVYLPELRPAALGQLGGLHGGLAYWRLHQN